MPGAFSKGGWAFMKDAIQHADRYFNGEKWVLGDQASANIDRVKLEQDLRARYNADFIQRWRTYVKSASVVRYASLADASQKLMQLSGNQSPLLELLALASQNTAVDDPEVTSAFQPVQTVVPPGSTDKYILPPNQSYVNALVTLQASLEAIAGQGGQPSDAAAAPALPNATQAKITTRPMAQAFRIGCGRPPRRPGEEAAGRPHRLRGRHAARSRPGGTEWQRQIAVRTVPRGVGQVSV